MMERTVKKIDIFAGLTRDQITEICGWLAPMHYPANAEIFREGQLPNGLFILSRGTVGVLKSSVRGKFRLATIEAPSYFGELGLLDAEERSAGIVSKTDVDVLLLPFDVFSAKLRANNLAALRVALNFGRIVCQRLRSTNTALAGKTAMLSKGTRRP
jgi:CRP/FNR family transcriptional regulator, cyclic AMP receptor protein